MKNFTTKRSNTGKKLMFYLSVIMFISFNFTIGSNMIFALQNHIGSHDPSSIVKDGSTYWIFTTGDGIYACNSTDMIKWSAASTPYTKTSYPSWINTYVPKFAGTFWAPECIYMNNKYYLYYACSTFGSRVSCIGLATSPSLNNPSWTDQGMVVYSTTSSDYNAIDPDVFFDASGKPWLTYGSWNTGIKMQELNTSTGKVANATRYAVCTFTDAENAQVVRNGSYYYLFVNRGKCCNGTSSTYYVQVGRSTSPNSGYTDWKTVLSSSGNFIGPGAVGYYSGDGAEWATFHYYDGDNNGSATLAVGQFIWSNGWPAISLDWLSNGTYSLKNVNSGLVWDAWGCTGASGQAIAQGTWNSLTCQKWTFTQLGNGYYKITCAQGGLSADATGCSSSNGTLLQLYSYSGITCQKWHVERTNTGSYVISSKNGNRVVEVPNASSTAGVQLGLWDYNQNNCQKWAITSQKSALEDKITETEQEPFELYPNPAGKNIFIQGAGLGSIYKIYAADGKLVKAGTLLQNIVDIETLSNGLYYIHITAPNQLLKTKFIKE